MMQLIHKEQPMDDKIRISDHLRGEKLIDFLAQTELGSRADHLAKVNVYVRGRDDPG